MTRLTGLSPHVLRAWERRYGAVHPLRTPGGTRRYREADVARLRRLRAAVAAGHSIGEVAGLSDDELERRLEMAPAGTPQPPLAPILSALEHLDADEAERLIGAQLSALGPGRFVRWVASPLLRDIGDRWARGSLCIASEHLGSAILRNLLGACLRAPRAAGQAPPILFTTPPGERHELGALMAAVAAIDAGGNPVFLGAELPVEEVCQAVASLGAGAVAVGLCRVNGAADGQALRALRGALPDAVELWIGGPGSGAIELPSGAARIHDPDELERKVALLAERGPAA